MTFYILGKENLKIYKTQFINLYYIPTSDQQPTFFKMITLLPDEKVIGIHLLGRNIDEMVQGFAVPMKMGATKRDFESVVAVHYTSSEELVTIR